MSDEDPLAGLTDKQRRFVEEYAVDFNATAAAKRAGYAESSARSIGWENLQKPHIREAITAYHERFAEEAEVSKKQVVAGLLREARRDDGEGGSTNARINAWKELGRHLGMFTDKIEHAGEVPSIEVMLTDGAGEDDG